MLTPTELLEKEDLLVEEAEKDRWVDIEAVKVFFNEVADQEEDIETILSIHEETYRGFWYDGAEYLEDYYNSTGDHIPDEIYPYVDWGQMWEDAEYDYTVFAGYNKGARGVYIWMDY